VIAWYWFNSHPCGGGGGANRPLTRDGGMEEPHRDPTCGIVQEEVSQILQRVSAGAAWSILLLLHQRLATSLWWCGPRPSFQEVLKWRDKYPEGPIIWSPPIISPLSHTLLRLWIRCFTMIDYYLYAWWLWTSSKLTGKKSRNQPKTGKCTTTKRGVFAQNMVQLLLSCDRRKRWNKLNTNKPWWFDKA